ncbi:LysM peptidoglycan-binding domain-containing protein [Verrucomicrobiales bacterium]|nr:LysM peptidoglycan-binding domain-containing protein [Verrucomicrobiales bacterium]
MNTFFRILVAGSVLALASCSSSKPKGKSTKALPKVSGAAPSGSSSARPVNHLSRSEYPFDASGNYITSWASSGSSSSYSKPKVRKTTYTAKPKPKPKPKYTPPVRKPIARYHIVRSGDTLYGLSQRYGKSISAIQRANGISGTGIRLGQRLRIP